MSTCQGCQQATEMSLSFQIRVPTEQCLKCYMKGITMSHKLEQINFQLDLFMFTVRILVPNGTGLLVEQILTY